MQNREGATMATIKNKVGSPFDIQTKNGPSVLPAFGTLEAEFDQGYLELLLACGTVVLADTNPQAPKVDADSIDTNEAKPAKKAAKGKA